VKYVTWILLISVLCFAACSNETSSIKNDKEAQGINPPPATDADNTARNANNPAADVTAQSESEADIQISAAVRKAVIDDKALSVNAHNVKITTANGVVTLRGPVKSEQEKSSIESKAKAVAGVSKVDNLLEVEKNP
jgi:hyperosmotically inducible periplasmic protein